MPPGGLVHHSDRGVQYACGEYIAKLQAHGIRPSMSRVGCPYDNAMAESFMMTLKTEEVDGRAYRDLAAASASIGSFIEQVYNHSDCIRRWPISRRSSSKRAGQVYGLLRSSPCIHLAFTNRP